MSGSEDMVMSPGLIIGLLEIYATSNGRENKALIGELFRHDLVDREDELCKVTAKGDA